VSRKQHVTQKRYNNAINILTSYIKKQRNFEDYDREAELSFQPASAGFLASSKILLLIYCLAYSSILNMEAIRSSETSGTL
jgi:hypothetical protein